MIKSSLTAIRRCAFAILFISFFAGLLMAQTPIRLFQTVNVVDRLDANPAINSKTLSVDHNALSSLFTSWHVIIQDVPLPSVSGIPEKVDLDLTEFTVIGEHTKVFIVENGERISAPLPTVRTYRGTVKGNPNTLVYIAAQPNGNITGYIRFDGLEHFLIDVSSSGDRYTSVITPVSAIPNFSKYIQCGADDESKYSPNPLHSSPKISPLQAPPSPLTASQTCVVACDVDNDGYSLLGSSVPDATNFVATCMAAISAVYESEVDVAMSLGNVNVFTTSDPYTGSSLDEILNSFTNNYHGSSDRSIAHLFSGKDIPSGAVGLAWLGVLCDQTRGYAVTNIFGSQSPGYAEYIAAHEIGHNVGSYHTHNCTAYPPNGIDHCYNAEGGCTWSTSQVKGSIMSYCNSKNFSFKALNDLAGGDGLRVVNVLKDGIASASCLVASAKITVNDTIINFPKTLYGSSKDTTIALVTNSGTDADLKITGVTFDVLLKGEFVLKNPPAFPVTLSPGQSLSLTVTFKPAGDGIRTGLMHLLHNAQGGMSGISLSGMGAAPVAAYTNSVLDFGNITDHNHHDSAIYYINNSGAAPLVITKTWIIDNVSSEFSIDSGGAGLKIAPGDSGKITIRFTPKTNGSKESYLDIKSNDPSVDTSFFSSITLNAIVSFASSVESGSVDDLDLLLSPNPFIGTLHAELRTGGKYSGENIFITIYDALGRKVAAFGGGKVSSEQALLSWQPDASLSQGTYLLVAKIGSSQIVKQIVYLK